MQRLRTTALPKPDSRLAGLGAVSHALTIEASSGGRPWAKVVAAHELTAALLIQPPPAGRPGAACCTAGAKA